MVSWKINYKRFPNGEVRAFGFHNGNLYTQATEKTKKEAKKSIKINIEQFKYMKGWKKKITPLNKKAYMDKF
jgi:uncharacterized lipoprotein YehR (DUF1307 family)